MGLFGDVPPPGKKPPRHGPERIEPEMHEAPKQPRKVNKSQIAKRLRAFPCETTFDVYLEPGTQAPMFKLTAQGFDTTITFLGLVCAFAKGMVIAHQAGEIMPIMQNPAAAARGMKAILLGIQSEMTRALAEHFDGDAREALASLSKMYQKDPGSAVPDLVFADWIVALTEIETSYAAHDRDDTEDTWDF